MPDMPTYYEILNVRPTATSAEIERAWDDAYNQVRRLVTHHDPKVANRANQGLQILEQVRATLLDSACRATYDDKIGISQVSELGIQEDGATPFTSPTPPSQRMGRTSAKPQTSEPPCPQCGSTENPSEARFCVSCQGPLTQTCPSCSAELRWFYPNCPKCGINIEVEQRRLKEEADRQQKAVLDEIHTHLENARQSVGMKRWRTAKEELTYFQGLGNPPSIQIQKNKQPKITPICSKENFPQQWKEAATLDQSANVIKSQLTRSLVGWTAMIYSGVGVLIGTFLGMTSAWSAVSRLPWYQAIFNILISAIIFAAMGAGVSAAAGALGSFIYANQWSGKQSNTTEHVLAALAPIGLGIAVGTAIMFSVFIIMAVIAVIAFMIWAGGG